MDKTFGMFLKEKRQEKDLTQKDLAKLLFVSESAVSKWEKDVAHPDITLLPKLSEILNVTEHELITASVDNKAREERTQAKKWRAVSMTWSLFFYIAYGVTVIPCFICKLAIDKTLSWFWIVFTALLLAFTFTNLPKLINKYKLILIPLSEYLALCILLATCAIYTKGNWFWIASLSVLLGLIIIFMPIYIAKYDIFNKVRKFNDFISVGIDFIMLNILLIVIDLYTVYNGYVLNHWYLNTAFIITLVCYALINLFLCVRFLKINRFLKTSIILFMVNILYIIPIFIKVEKPKLQYELDSLNIFKANFSNWLEELTLERNVHCILFLTVFSISLSFLITGLIRYFKFKNNANK